MDDIQTDEFLLDIWIRKQSDDDMASTASLLKKFTFGSIAGINDMMSAINDYRNTLPYWRFMGRTSQEIAEEERAQATRAPRLVAGPNMRARGLDIPEGLQAAVDRMWTAPAPSSGSYRGVGRNDLCPCGSGKKYKKCCGR